MANADFMKACERLAQQTSKHRQLRIEGASAQQLREQRREIRLAMDALSRARESSRANAPEGSRAKVLEPNIVKALEEIER
ncbi:hypothetical protein LJC33_00325 [Eubacteriales bacterium OttesenSCG-928-N13]|nr:hypothetical protein [Eubacteriales bacterium OttesenSCG-928-N13]